VDHGVWWPFRLNRRHVAGDALASRATFFVMGVFFKSRRARAVRLGFADVDFRDTPVIRNFSSVYRASSVKAAGNYCCVVVDADMNFRRCTKIFRFSQPCVAATILVTFYKHFLIDHDLRNLPLRPR
jgi:hypothetical protein